MDEGARPQSNASEALRLLARVARRYLTQLSAILALLDEHALASGLAERDVLDRRLVPDMLPLGMQARIAMEFPFRAIDQMTEHARRRNPVDMMSLAGLRDSILERRALLDLVEAAAIEGACPNRLRDRAGEADIEESASDFITLYVLPNVFFHVSAVYLTCRMLGVSLGKGDFDGFHVYTAAPKT